MLASAHLHPREAIQHLTHAVLDANGGELRDNATSLCFDWHGGAQGAAYRTPAQNTGHSATPLIPSPPNGAASGPLG